MPFNWNAEKERAMLLIACADLKPGTATWHTVANRLGGGLSANAVSQKFYKLKKESEKLINSDGATAPSTPAPKQGRKAPGTTTTNRKRKGEVADQNRETPAKRIKRQVTALEALARLDDGDDIKPDPDAEVKKEADGGDLQPISIELIDLEMKDARRKAEEA